MQDANEQIINKRASKPASSITRAVTNTHKQEKEGRGTTQSIGGKGKGKEVGLFVWQQTEKGRGGGEEAMKRGRKGDRQLCSVGD